MLDRTLRYTKALDAAQEDKVDTLERGKMALKRQELAHYMPRKWNTGDVYGPHDLSPAEQNKWGKPQRPTQDIIDILGINPLDHYKVNIFYFLLPLLLIWISLCCGLSKCGHGLTTGVPGADGLQKRPL